MGGILILMGLNWIWFIWVLFRRFSWKGRIWVWGKGGFGFMVSW